MQFRYYVLNYDHNKHIVEPFNIFDNITVNDWTVKAVKKYLRCPSKYEYKPLLRNRETLHGFEALCEDIKCILACEEWGRMEYEMSVGYKFEKDCKNLQYTDCYSQAILNLECITRECIYQYKEWKKEQKKW